MSITKHEIDDFHQFAVDRLDQFQPVPTIDELVDEWKQSREFAEIVDDIQAGLKDLDAGKGQSLGDAFEDVRQQLGINS